MEGSGDLVAGRDAARRLGLPWEPAVVRPPEIPPIIKAHARDLEGVSPVVRSVLVAFSTAVARARPGNLVCGQGVDELFLGYAHFRGLGSAAALERARADLDRLRTDDWPRARRIAARLGKTVHAPYLDPGFVRAASALPIEARLPDPEPKAWFRRWAEHRGLPPELAHRPKRALQYGSGIDRVLRRARP
jgi:asparagine synthase (glutamine-hydrolysing)